MRMPIGGTRYSIVISLQAVISVEEDHRITSKMIKNTRTSIALDSNCSINIVDYSTQLEK